MKAIFLTISLVLLIVGCDGKKSDAISEINSTNLAKCKGEYSVSTWTNCYGERKTADGGSYKGGYLEGKANGKGEFTNSDGSRYLGDYLNGKRNGSGKEYAANGSILKEGEWSNGVFVQLSQQSQIAIKESENPTVQNSNKNFLIGLCTVSNPEWENFKCNSNLAMQSDEMSVLFQTFEESDVVLDLVFGSKCGKLLGPSRCVNKTFRSGSTYEMLSNGAVIQNTLAGGCTVPTKYSMENGILYEDYGGEARGTCKEEQIAAAKQLRVTGKEKKYYVKKS
jgi:hypothetical protein